MTLQELIEHLRKLGLSEDTINGMASTYDLGYAQGLIDSTNKEHELKFEKGKEL
jgi:hypothetical protein